MNWTGQEGGLCEGICFEEEETELLLILEIIPNYQESRFGTSELFWPLLAVLSHTQREEK